MGILDAIWSFFAPGVAWAEEASHATSAEAMGAIKDASQSISDTALNGVGDIIPVVAPLAAALIAIFIVWRVVKKFTKTSTG